uniref:Rho GTPase activating protein 28 n=1 Tax=Scophthalmus maximus TaxID=52904 RepID=A0A8D3DCC6_SCOMX
MLSSSSSSSSSPAPHTVTSNPRHVALETYWREVQSIEEEREGEDEYEDDERKSIDEGEMEASWLTEAGLSSLVTGSEEETPPPAEALLSTLTRQQAVTVRRRLDNYNETMKKRNKQPIRDIRDVFNQAPPLPPTEAPPLPPTEAPTLPLTAQSHQVDTTPPQRPSADTVTQVPVCLLTCLSVCAPVCLFTCLSVFSSVCLSVCLIKTSNKTPERDNMGLLIKNTNLTSLHITCLSLSVCLSLPFSLSLCLPVSLSDGGVFGVPLNLLLQNDRKKFPAVKVPIVFQKLLCILESSLQTEGILRVPGSAARLKHLRRELDRCGGAIDWSAVRQVEAAGLLKLFIRELPTPLLTHTHLSTYLSLTGVPSLVHQLQALQLLSLLLPDVNRNTLRALLVFLRKVVSHQDQNRMSLWNVSMVMAPNLFSYRHRGNKQSVAKQQEMEEAMGGAQLVRLMITHQDLLWTVPRFLLSQVRQMNQAANQKPFSLTRTKRRLLRKNDRNQISDLCDGVIRVHAPLHTKVSMAIQLDGQTRAKDVTSRFENSPAQCLYEVGGNICERRLHPDCFLLDVYRLNPHCDWLIKP